jgi:hypothetical protein
MLPLHTSVPSCQDSWTSPVRNRRRVRFLDRRFPAQEHLIAGIAPERSSRGTSAGLSPSTSRTGLARHGGAAA